MCCFDRGTNLFENIDDPRDRKRAFLGNDVCQRAAIEIFHDEVGHWTMLGLCKAEVGDVNDVWVPQATGGFCFTAEACNELIVG